MLQACKARVLNSLALTLGRPPEPAGAMAERKAKSLAILAASARHHALPASLALAVCWARRQTINFSAI